MAEKKYISSPFLNELYKFIESQTHLSRKVSNKALDALNYMMEEDNTEYRSQINMLVSNASYDEDDSFTGAFVWSATTEGHEFWEKVFRGDK